MDSQAEPLALKVKAVPHSSKTEIVGWIGDALKVRLQAPAEKNQANKALIAVLAKTLNVPPRKIRLASGHRSSQKQLLIEGVNEATMLRLLQ